MIDRLGKYRVIISLLLTIPLVLGILFLSGRYNDDEEIIEVELEPLILEGSIELPPIITPPTVVIPPLTIDELMEGEVGYEELDSLFVAWTHIHPQGQRIVDISVFYAALSKTGFPQHLWSRLWVISSRCEAIATQSPEIGPPRAAVDVFAIGDNGLAIGAMQIRVDYHPEQAAKYNLLSLEENLLAAYEVYAEVGNSLGPWSCNTKLFPNG